MAIFKYFNAYYDLPSKILPAFVLTIMIVIIVIIGLIKNKKKLIYLALGIPYIL
jgi:hypothetical protein